MGDRLVCRQCRRIEPGEPPWGKVGLDMGYSNVIAVYSGNSGNQESIVRPARACPGDSPPLCTARRIFSVDAGPFRPATLPLPVTGPSLGRGLSAPLCDTQSAETADWTITIYFSLLAH